MLEDDETVWVSTSRLEASNNPAFWHTDRDCYQLKNTENGITTLTVAEAREQCDRQASCCRSSHIPALEDHDTDEVMG